MWTGRLWLWARERGGGGWEEAACTSTVRMCTSSEAGHTSDGVSAPGEVLVAACATASDSAKFVQLAAQLAAMYLRHEAGGGVYSLVGAGRAGGKRKISGRGMWFGGGAVREVRHGTGGKRRTR